MEVLFYKATVLAKAPEYKTTFSRCADLYCAETKILWPFNPTKINTGLIMHADADIRPRSSTPFKNILVHYGTIERDYPDEWQIIVNNIGWWPIKVKAGERIAQAYFGEKQVTFKEVKRKIDLPKVKSNRSGGLGSTG